jgi:hypothetical protein
MEGYDYIANNQLINYYDFQHMFPFDFWFGKNMMIAIYFLLLH